MERAASARAIEFLPARTSRPLGVAAASLEVSLGRLPQDRDVQRVIRYQFLQPGILLSMDGSDELTQCHDRVGGTKCYAAAGPRPPPSRHGAQPLDVLLVAALSISTPRLLPNRFSDRAQTLEDGFSSGELGGVGAVEMNGSDELDLLLSPRARLPLPHVENRASASIELRQRRKAKVIFHRP